MVEEIRSDSEGSLFFDLRTVHGVRDRIDRSYPSSFFKSLLDDDGSVVESVSVDLKIEKDADTYRVKGRLGTTIRLACGRCLELYEIRVDSPVDLLFLPKPGNSGQAEFEMSAEDLSTAFYSDDELDIGQLIGEQLRLEVPMKPLCRAECEGLCPVCGKNKNTSRCSCQNSWHDPRFDGLRAWLAEDRGNGRKE